MDYEPNIRVLTWSKLNICYKSQLQAYHIGKEKEGFTSFSASIISVRKEFVILCLLVLYPSCRQTWKDQINQSQSWDLLVKMHSIMSAEIQYSTITLVSWMIKKYKQSSLWRLAEIWQEGNTLVIKSRMTSSFLEV